ncbi:DUF5329 family protein [Kiritimatiellota bacterium B12222]|nr:DUF5329 family protein [Kiritimatiellota bacterium B12222]
MKKLIPLLFLILALPLFATEDTATIVSELITMTNHSGAEFIRNGKTHSAQEASEHLEKKYKHFLKKGKIKTPEDFIKYAGTKSLVSGKYYMLKFPDGTEEKSATWLTAQLANIRAEDEQHH